MEYLFNYVFAIIFPFGQDGWKILSLLSIIFFFKYFNCWKKDRIVFSLFLFLLYGLLLTVCSNNISLSFLEIQSYFVGCFFPFLLGLSVADNKHKIKILNLYLIIFSSILVVGFLAYFQIIPDMIFYATFIRDNRLAILCNHTIFGGKYSFVLITLLVLFLFKSNEKNLYEFFLIFLMLYKYDSLNNT